MTISFNLKKKKKSILHFSAFIEVGGMPALYAKYMHAVAEPLVSNATDALVYSSDASLYGANLTLSNNTVTALSVVANDTCGKPRDDAFHMFRDPVNSDLPWPGVVFRATFASLWNWCADQVKGVYY